VDRGARPPRCPRPGVAREQALEQIRDAIDLDRLPGEAVEVLIAVGWIELDD
jgi:hypothetical protein